MAGTNDISAGLGPYGVAVNPVTNRIFVNDRLNAVLLGNFITVIEGGSVGTTPVFTSFALGQSLSAGIIFNTTTNRVYVASQSFNNGISFDTTKGAVTVIDGTSTGVLPVILAQIQIPQPVTGIDVNTTTNKIYVSGTSNVYVINGITNAITSTIPIGGGSFGVGVNETTNKIYVALNAAGTVKVIDGSTDTLTGATITVGAQPQDVEVNTATNKIYVANGGSNTVSIIDGTSDAVVATFSLSLSFPAGVGVNESTNRVYVANQANDTVTVLGGLTAVNQMSFNALRQGNNALIQWQTGYEVNNLGFDLYREQKGKRTRINSSLIAGSALLAGAGTEMTAGNSYSWLDPSGTSDSKYYLEDIDLSGARTLHGPIVPAVSSSSIISDRRKQAMLLSQLNAQAESTSGISKWQKGWPAYTGEGRELLYHLDDKPGVDIQHLIASKGAIKLSVNREGWYRVTQADLVAAGFNEQVDARMLRLYTNKVEVPLLMNAAKQQFSPGDSFEFYGAGLDTPTTDTSTYWLITGYGKGSRITPQTRSATPTQTTATSSATQSQSRQGSGSQVLTASPTRAGIPSSLSPSYLFNWIIAPVVKPVVRKLESIRPANEDPVATKVAPSRADSVKASTPPKKSRRSKNRTRKPRRKAALRNHATLSLIPAQSYPYTVELKEKIIYASSIRNGDEDNFYGQAIASAPVNEKIYLSNLSQSSSGTSQLKIALQGLTLVGHQIKVKINGQAVGTLSFRGQEHAVAELSVPSSSLLEGENTITLERAGGDTDVSLVDWIRLTYEHSYRADGNVLRFMAEGSTRLDGFAYNNIRVMDISDPRRMKEIACTVEASSNGYAAILQAPGSGGEYIAFTDNATSRPASITLDKASNLKASDNGADLVIISNGDFISSVQPLAELRRKEGLAVSVVDVEDVYDEFSSGAHSPYAIKDFLSWAKSHWQKSPAFVLLVGDGSLDPRNYQGNGVTDFVPTKLIDASTMETASDDWLADFNNDGVAEMAVGRLPVRTKAEADRVINKITGYTSASAQQQVLMVVDRNNASDSFSFAQTGTELGSMLPSSISMNIINRANSSDDATAHTDIINAINQGPLMVNYIGHGSVEVWTGAPILSATDTSALNNTNHLPVFVMMTCLNGYFPNPARDSLAEALLRNNTSGAVAVWASSGMTEASAQAQMNRQLYAEVFGQEGMRLGEAVQKAKASTGDMDVRRTWVLFGDPTMRIR